MMSLRFLFLFLTIHHSSDALAVSNSHYGRGSGPILFTRIECNGDEGSILECSRVLHASTCSHADDAGVSCTGMLVGIH